MLTGLIIVVALALWWDRNKAAWRRMNQKPQRPCYHGITRHDSDWSVR